MTRSGTMYVYVCIISMYETYMYNKKWCIHYLLKQLLNMIQDRQHKPSYNASLQLLTFGRYKRSAYGSHSMPYQNYAHAILDTI